MCCIIKMSCVLPCASQLVRIHIMYEPIVTGFKIISIFESQIFKVSKNCKSLFRLLCPHVLSNVFMTVTPTSTSESVINRSNFLNLSDLWDFPAVSLSPAVTGREKKPASDTAAWLQISHLCFPMWDEPRTSGPGWCCWRWLGVTQSQEVICLVCREWGASRFCCGSLWKLQLSWIQRQLGLVRRFPTSPLPPLRSARPIRPRWKMTKKQRKLLWGNICFSECNTLMETLSTERLQVTQTHQTKQNKGYNISKKVSINSLCLWKLY